MKKFSKREWYYIRRELHDDPVGYGLPERRYGTVVIGSFNIRKLGSLEGPSSESGRDEPTMQFLADVCRHFDLLAVQEVMPDLSAVQRLRELMGPEYGIIVSDIVGTFPGERGNEERLAYIYNRALIRRGPLVTEVSTSRTRVLSTIAQHHRDIYTEMDRNSTAKQLREYTNKTLPNYLKDLREGKKPKKPRQPKFAPQIDTFLQFIRTPFAAEFEVVGHPGTERYRFLAVNAHLHFGRPAERRSEAEALAEWIIEKVAAKSAPNILLLGDLNFDFDKPTTDLERIRSKFAHYRDVLNKKAKVFISFPFIFPHPRPAQQQPEGTIFRSNIGLSQTYDQIGIFSQDKRLGDRLETTFQGHSANEAWGKPGGPDYGVFNFTDLFSRALNRGKTSAELTTKERRAFLSRFEHSVSDHMPIWFRMALPGDASGFPLKTT